MFYELTEDKNVEGANAIAEIIDKNDKIASFAANKGEGKSGQ